MQLISSGCEQGTEQRADSRMYVFSQLTETDVSEAVKIGIEQASQTEPLTYLIILFLLVFMWLHSRSDSEERKDFMDVLNRIGEAEDRRQAQRDAADKERMATMQIMAATCHAKSDDHLKSILAVTNRCETALEDNSAAMDRNTSVLEKILRDQNA